MIEHRLVDKSKSRKKAMNTRLIATLLGLLVLSGTMCIAIVNAAPWPYLPTTVVQLIVEDGTTTFFISTLSGVPAGYDVHNGDYPGWCIEMDETMERGDSHDVTLFSSLAPPDVFKYINWIKINYILNHKQGSMMDVQRAIWHYTDNQDVTGIALAMVQAADTNYLSYDPLTGAVFAVICQREAASGEGVQNSIIEITRLFGLSPGYWKHNVKVYNGGPGSYSGTPLHESNETMESYAATILAAHQAEITSEDPNVDTVEEFLTWANIRFQDNAFKKGTPSWLELANWFNEAAGRSPYVDTD